MAEYVNSCNINISDIVRLEFLDVSNRGQEIVSTVCMQIEMFRNLINVMQQTLDDHQRKLVSQAEANRKLS